MTGEEGAKKKEYVERLLAEKGYDINLNEIDAMIEAAVKNLKMKLKETNIVVAEEEVPDDAN